MEQIKFEDLNIFRIGNEIDLSGMIYNDTAPDGSGISYLISFPNGSELQEKVVQLNLNHDEFKKFIQQTDLLETEILDNNTNRKIVVRKSQRQLDANVSWKVFRRDHYTCRYCGADDVPLTIDHLILWEHQGPTTEENLLSACKRCNKTRGNMVYDKWLESAYYNKVRKNLPILVHQANLNLKEDIKKIQPSVHKRNR